MQMKKESPGTVLKALLKKHGLNYSSLAKEIGLSGAMVRLIALDQNPVSPDVAFRLAKFFKTRPEYWLDLQIAHDIANTAKDKKLAKVLKGITTVDKAAKNKAKPGRKAKAKRTAKKRKAVKGAKKTAGRRGRPAKSAAAKKVKPAGKRGRPAAKKTAARRGRPASKAKAKAKAKPKAKRAVKAKVKKSPAEPRPTSQASVPASQPAGTVNEPNI